MELGDNRRAEEGAGFSYAFARTLRAIFLFIGASHLDFQFTFFSAHSLFFPVRILIPRMVIAGFITRHFFGSQGKTTTNIVIIITKGEGLRTSFTTTDESRNITPI